MSRAVPVEVGAVETATGGHVLTPTESEQAVVEALLDQLVAQQNPWEMLDTIVAQRVPPEHRQNFYNPFIALVAVRAASEQDALIAAGQPVFRYRTQTARDEVEKLRETGADTVQLSPSVLCDDFMAEIVHMRGESPPIKYLVYKLDGTTELADHVQIRSVRYMPPQTQLINKRTLSLPTGVEEYEDHANLFRDIRHFIDAYVHIPTVAFRNIVTFYVFLTWIFDRFDAVPYLRFEGEVGSGKTRALQVVGALSQRGITASGATTSAPIFRLVSMFRGTFMFDEADFSKSDLWSDMSKLLNSGYMKDVPVLRMGKNSRDQWDPESYDVYGPKVLSTRRRFGDGALESRCVSYTMTTVEVPRGIPYALDDTFRAEAAVLRNKLLLWRFRTFRNITVDTRERVDGLDPRLNQIVLPLMACAEDDHMKRAIVNVAREYQSALREDRRESFEGKLALVLLQRWRAHRDRGFSDVQLKELYDSLRAELGEQAKISAKRIGETVRHIFALSTVGRGGTTWVIVSERDARRVAQKYTLDFDAFGRRALQSDPTDEGT